MDAPRFSYEPVSESLRRYGGTLKAPKEEPRPLDAIDELGRSLEESKRLLGEIARGQEALRHDRDSARRRADALATYRPPAGLSRWWAFLAGAALGALLLLLVGPAMAQEPPAPEPCPQRSDLLAMLGRNYGETPSARGFETDVGAVLEITTNPVTGTWSALLSRPDGVSCLVAEGEGWTIIPQGDDL